MSPCRADCNKRRELLDAEDRIARLQQVKRWVNDLERQEPHCHQECQAKEQIVVTKLVQTLAEAGVLVNKLAAGCRPQMQQRKLKREKDEEVRSNTMAVSTQEPAILTPPTQGAIFTKCGPKSKDDD